MNAKKTIKLGTRGSPLALAQAKEVKARLLALHSWLEAPQLEICVISTRGDQIQDKPLSEAGGKGLFSKEIEETLSQGHIDLAVHSMKDMATLLPTGLEIPVILPREDVRDAWISKEGITLEQLPLGSVVGTASLRRKALILQKRPDLDVIIFRGSVQTRLRKLQEGQADATLLALAGLKRLGLEDKASMIFPVQEMLPAVSQGAIGLEVRSDNHKIKALIAPLNDPLSFAQITAERALLAILDGSCRTPIAAYAEPLGQGRLRLHAFASTPDGKKAYRECQEGKNPQALGEAVGWALRKKAGNAFFRALQDYKETWRVP